VILAWLGSGVDALMVSKLGGIGLIGQTVDGVVGEISISSGGNSSFSIRIGAIDVSVNEKIEQFGVT